MGTKVTFFGAGLPAAATPDPDQIGGKAANLVRMSQIGLPVPPGFVLSTELCREYFDLGERLPDDFDAGLAANVRLLERATGRGFGSLRRPLLVSVRSGAAASMPGMMESILNLGLNETSARGMVRATGNPRLVWDSFRRLVESYAEVVDGHSPEPFERILGEICAAHDADSPRSLDAESAEAAAQRALEVYRALQGSSFPRDPHEQLRRAIEAVIRSWRSPKAVTYRRLHGLGEDGGTAVTVQIMVFGNAGGTSGSGVCFTRDPSLGIDAPYIDFMLNAQGEDIVSGRGVGNDTARLPRVLPQLGQELRRLKTILESEFRDLQDFEFTVEEGRLFILQTRSGRRSPWAALHVAVDMVRQRLQTPEEALERLRGVDLQNLARLALVPDSGADEIATAIPANAGVAVGKVALDPERAVEMAGEGETPILVRDDIATEDIAGLAAAGGLLTARGSRTSHAAVVAREMGKVCLVACHDLRIDLRRRAIRIGTRQLLEGDDLSLDGDSGRIYAGKARVRRLLPTEALAEVAAWRNPTARHQTSA